MLLNWLKIFKFECMDIVFKMIMSLECESNLDEKISDFSVQAGEAASGSKNKNLALVANGTSLRVLCIT